MLNICKLAETLYGPKQILDSDDWLACEEEDGQTFVEFEKCTERNKVDQ